MSFIGKLFKKPKVKTSQEEDIATTSNQTTNATGTINEDSTQTATNAAYPWLMEQFGSSVEQGQGANNFIAGLLGLPGGDAAGATTGFNQYLDSAGYDNVIRDVTRGHTASAAAKGLLNSGITARGIGKDIMRARSGFFDNYLAHLAGLQGMGLQGAQLIANTADQTQRNVGTQTRTENSTSVGSGTSKGTRAGTQTAGGSSPIGTIGKVVGGIASIFSDRRLKTDIEKIDEMEDGLGIYRFRYIDTDEIDVGVMASEVEKLRPWAMGPEVRGMKTVMYEVL